MSSITATAIIAALETTFLLGTKKTETYKTYQSVIGLIKSTYYDRKSLIHAISQIESQPSSLATKMLLQNELNEIEIDKNSRIYEAAINLIKHLESSPKGKEIIQETMLLTRDNLGYTQNHLNDYKQDSVWFYTDGFQRLGPVTEKDLQMMYIKGDVDKNLNVWTLSLEKWTELGNTKLLDDCCVHIPSVNEPEDTFGNNSSTSAMITFIIVVGLTVFSIFYSSMDYAGKIELLTTNRKIFLIYLSTYIGVWITYFASGINWDNYNFPTLRRLLTDTSLQWEHRNNQRDAYHPSISFNLISTEREETYRQKAGTAITALAMLVSASLIELLAANVIYLNLFDELDPWNKVLLVAVILSAFTSFVCFIIAVDALESLFNRFKTKEWTHQLMKHFYSRSINPRYSGFAFLIGGAVLLISIHNPLLASSTIGIIFFVGLSHWFPSTDLLKKTDLKYSKCRSVIKVLIFFAVIFPLGILSIT